MKKCPRWAALLAALTVILTSTLAPLEGAAAPGPIKLPDDPNYTLGDPDSPPYNIIEIMRSLRLELLGSFLLVSWIGTPAPASHRTTAGSDIP